LRVEEEEEAAAAAAAAAFLGAGSVFIHC